MHVLIVNRHLEDVPGGSENQCHEISVALEKLGHNVTYAICRPNRGRYEVDYSVELIRGRFANSFEAVLQRVRPDVVYWRYNKRCLLKCVRVARKVGIPFVFAVSHINDIKTFAAKPSFRAATTRFRQLARMILYGRDLLNSAINAQGLRLVDGIVFQHGGQVPRKLNVRSEIIFNSYPPVDTAPAPSAVPYVLWVSNIKRAKNPEVFVRLAQDLRDTGVEFWMAGGLQDSAYAWLLREEELPDNLCVLGGQSQSAIDSLLRGSLFLAHTCSEEGFPNVFIQAWLQGRTVVSAYFDPGRLMVSESIGLYSGGYHEFKHDVARLIDDERLREALGTRAFRFAKEQCNPRKNAAKLASFLAQVARN